MPPIPSKPVASLNEKLKGVRVGRKRKEPLWKGPLEDGITQSLLCRFLACRERFRILVWEGLKPHEGFNHRLEYGNMWHVCEEALAANWPYLDALSEYCRGLCRQYPLQQNDIAHWMRTCQAQFPEYVKYWAEHEDVQNRTPLMQEETFAIPYRLPSGRTVTLRGKFDSVDLIGNGPPCTCGADRTGPSAETHAKSCPASKPHTVTGVAGIYLQENKTKGDIHERNLQRQLSFDLQTMFYLTALQQLPKQSRFPDKYHYPIKGVRYNVIRRPFAGGRGNIKQLAGSKNRKAETADEYYSRLVNDYIAKEPEYWFMRWKVDISPRELEVFQSQCLNPILESLCEWWDYINHYSDAPFHQGGNVGGTHWRFPFGVWNPLTEGGATDVDEYLTSGSEVGLSRTDNLFPEL